ncbi:MAG: anaerobic dehydrogenase, typically selenocysteine-containing [Marmoricola sp.]|nr:anaerobic dehydrogenase, typically selenocysteine-containing [Marmoricola sp.]
MRVFAIVPTLAVPDTGFPYMGQTSSYIARIWPWEISDALPGGVANMHTGAWYDPSAPDVADCVHGNVNVLAPDVSTSTLSQATSGAHVLVRIERYDGVLPPVRART